jgi:hypothetical protein
LLKHLIYIFVFLSLTGTLIANGNKNGNKEQTKTVILKISDNSGEELAGAKIKIAETGKEFIADFNGVVQLSLKKEETVTLQVISLGFESVSLKSSEISTFQELNLNPLN